MNIEFTRAGYSLGTLDAYYQHEFKCSARYKIFVFVLMWAFCLLFSVRRKTHWRVYPKIEIALPGDWSVNKAKAYVGYARFSTTKGRGWVKHKPVIVNDIKEFLDDITDAPTDDGTGRQDP